MLSLHARRPAAVAQGPSRERGDEKMGQAKPAFVAWSRCRIVAAGLTGYTVGSILTADLVVKVVARRSPATPDLRRVGSGNPGAANAFANLGTGWGIGILAGDIFKGAIAAQAGRVLAGDAGGYLAASAAVAGHCFPLWSRFRGGKGVATSAGTTLVAFPAYVPIDLGLVGLSFLASRHAARATAVASSVFVMAAFVWRWRRWPNLWGTKPTWGLPAYAVATTSMIAYRFFTSPRHMGDADATAGAEQSDAHV